MDGYLKKWTNVITRWKINYFVLKDGILSYQQDKGFPIKGLIHMKICEVNLSPDDPLKFLINSGTKTMILRAETLNEKIKWIKALQQAKDQIKEEKKSNEKEIQNLQKVNEHSKINEFRIQAIKDMYYNNDKETEEEMSEHELDISKLIQKKVNQIWDLQIQFDQLLSDFQGYEDNVYSPLIKKFDSVCQNIITSVASLMKIVEIETLKLQKMIKNLNQHSDFEQFNQIIDSPKFYQNSDELKIQRKLDFDEEGKIQLKENQKYKKMLDKPTSFKQKLDPLPENFQDPSVQKQSLPQNQIKNDFSQNFYIDSNFKDIKIQKSFQNHSIDKKENNLENKIFNQNNKIQKINSVEIMKNTNSSFQENKNSNFFQADGKDITFNSFFNDDANQSKVKQGHGDSFQSFEDFSKIDQSFSKRSKSLDNETIISKEIFDTTFFQHLENSFLKNPINQSWHNYLKNLQLYDPLKYQLLANNEAFIQYPLNNEKKRIQLPLLLDKFDENLDVWQIVKQCLIKGMSKMQIPVQINEPLSHLQRLGEQFEYSQLINIANQIDRNPPLQMAYVIAFAVSQYAHTHDRYRKSFYPMLGETFGYEDESRQIKFLAEQVEPDTIAVHCFSPNFTYFTNHKLDTVFDLASQSIQFMTSGNVHLKLHQSAKNTIEYTFNRPITTIDSFNGNKFKIDHKGEVCFANQMTGDHAKIQFFSNRQLQHQVQGIIQDKNHHDIYKIEGSWTNILKIINIQNKKELILWKKNKPLNEKKLQYDFSEFSLQLNYINEQILNKVATSDSRLRPDIRALEMRNLDLASEYKRILMNKNKNNVIQYEQNNWQSNYFEMKQDQKNQNHQIYLYKENYWNQQKLPQSDIFLIN